MLVDLEPLDVVVRQKDSQCSHDCQNSDKYLGFQGASERVPSYHYSANIRQQEERDDHISADPMKDEGFMAYYWNEL